MLGCLLSIFLLVVVPHHTVEESFVEVVGCEHAQRSKHKLAVASPHRVLKKDPQSQSADVSAQEEVLDHGVLVNVDFLASVFTISLEISDALLEISEDVLSLQAEVGAEVVIKVIELAKHFVMTQRHFDVLKQLLGTRHDWYLPEIIFDWNVLAHTQGCMHLVLLILQLLIFLFNFL